jgi:hypothetical protein
MFWFRNVETNITLFFRDFFRFLRHSDFSNIIGWFVMLVGGNWRPQRNPTLPRRVALSITWENRTSDQRWQTLTFPLCHSDSPKIGSQMPACKHRALFLTTLACNIEVLLIRACNINSELKSTNKNDINILVLDPLRHVRWTFYQATRIRIYGKQISQLGETTPKIG